MTIKRTEQAVSIAVNSQLKYSMSDLGGEECCLSLQQQSGALHLVTGAKAWRGCHCFSSPCRIVVSLCFSN